MSNPIPVICRADAGGALQRDQIEKCLGAVEIGHEDSSDTSRSRRRSDRDSNTTGYDVTAALTAGEPSARVLERLQKSIANCLGTERHNKVRNDVLVLLVMGINGEPGVRQALAMLRGKFIDAVGPDRSGGEIEAGDEFDRFIYSDRVAQLLIENGLPISDASFWLSTPVLEHVLTFSRARGVAPYPVLGAVLRRAVGCVDPHVVLPAIVGGPASLNLFTATVGRSGAGKDAANAAGHDAVTFVIDMGSSTITFVEAQHLHAGTGEGLVRSLMPDETSASSGRGHLQVADVGTLEALAARQGQTLHAILLSAWMGQPLGFRNNVRHTSTAVAAHSYRLCLSVGVQPGNADFFLSREKDGLPQRFLWLPATDPSAPRNRPAEVAPIDVLLPSFPAGPQPPFIFEVPPRIQTLVMDHRHKVLTGDPSVDPLDGHVTLTQLKVAVALSVLHGQHAVTEQMWSLAEHMIEVSAHVRDHLREESKAKRDRINTAHAHDRADRQLVSEQYMSEGRRGRVERAIVNRLKRAGAQTSDPPRCVRRVLPLGRMDTWVRSHRGGIQRS